MRGEKEYVGQRSELTGELFVEVIEEGKRPRSLHHVVHHSPDGFEVGYSGSGPADLALSILADTLGEHPSPDEIYHGRAVCLRHHQEFKQRHVAGRGAPFAIPASEIEAFLRERGIDPARPAWLRVMLPEHPAARELMTLTLHRNAQGMLDAADEAANEETADALRDAAYEVYSALDAAGLGEPEEAAEEEV